MPQSIASRPEFSVATVIGDENFWQVFASTLIPIYLAAFRKLIKRNNENDFINNLEWAVVFNQPDVFLLSTHSQIVGFSILAPADTPFDHHESERETLGLSALAYMKLQFHTANVASTVIDPGYQNRGGWSKMMNEIDNKILGSNRFHDLTRTARTLHGYDQRLTDRYPGKLIYESPVTEIYGPQRYLRFRLKQPNYTYDN